jgi:hypothetical protein
MTKVGENPAFVLDNAAKRLAAGIRARTRRCVHDECDQAATHWPATGSPACEEHRTRPTTPIPDPLMAEAYLRKTRGSLGTPARTNFDNTVEAKGQRVSAAKRAHIRGDNDIKDDA